MRLKEVLEKVDRSQANTYSACISEFCDALGITDILGWSEEFSKRVKKHYLIKWYCTGTWVGVCVYYMDGIPVAISTQTARKSDVDYKFTCNAAVRDVRNFIRELEDHENPTIDLIDPTEEVSETYTVSFAGQLLTSYGTYKGRSCTVVEKVPGYISKRIIVSFDDSNSIKEIDVKDFKIPINIE
jgi:hypothetical protein